VINIRAGSCVPANTEYWLLIRYVYFNYIIESMGDYKIFDGVFFNVKIISMFLGQFTFNQDVPELFHGYSEEFRKGKNTRALI
jgi:hypothetical protein